MVPLVIRSSDCDKVDRLIALHRIMRSDLSER